MDMDAETNNERVMEVFDAVRIAGMPSGDVWLSCWRNMFHKARNDEEELGNVEILWLYEVLRGDMEAFFLRCLHLIGQFSAGRSSQLFLLGHKQ